ncbi:hypothetical protein ACTD5D_40070 [Nocardia takedensis]|uniref:hypothetical protein n=1 Tax=Nocardia takedensis TaxID=259390 RepID=UPI003F767770
MQRGRRRPETVVGPEERQWMPPLASVDSGADSGEDPASAGWAQRWLDPSARAEAAGPLDEFDAGAESAAVERGAQRPVLGYPDDDPMAPLVAGLRGRAARAAQRRTLIRVVAIGAAVAGLIAVVASVVLVVDVVGEQPSTPAPGAAATLVPATATPTILTPPWCAEVDSGGRVVGAGPGDLTSGPGVILAQQYAMYVSRDAEAARAVLAPQALAADPEATKKAIDQTPAGTKHCVTVTALASDRFDVRVDEQRPGTAVLTWQQIVTTVTVEGRVLITSITAGGGN